MIINQKQISDIDKFISPNIKDLLNHPIYSNISTESGLKLFMESHIFAVWDFMSIVKSLQIYFTTVSLPWMPPHNAKISRLINEIVLDEESDINEYGEAKSHFELYVDSMNAFGADTAGINNFLELINRHDLDYGIETAILPAGVKKFLKTTFSFINHGEIHQIASIFTFSREGIIPDMFISIVKKINNNTQGSLDKFIYYLERHIELDGDRHNKLCLQMLSQICGDDDVKWQEAKYAAQKSVMSRIALWDGINEIQKNSCPKIC